MDSSGASCSEGSSNWIKPIKKRAEIWKELLIHRRDQSLVKCTHCEKTFRYHGSTSSLTYHLKKHGFKPAQECAQAELEARQPLISSYMKVSSVNMVIARLVALDRLPFTVVAKSSELRKGFEARNLNVPTCKKTIRKIVLDLAKEVEAGISSHLQSLREEGTTFSLSIDEWTSGKNRR